MKNGDRAWGETHKADDIHLPSTEIQTADNKFFYFYPSKATSTSN
jgi:hypothetical protein